MCDWSVYLKCVLILKFVVNFTICHHKIPNEKISEEVFSEDFEDFLKGLGSKVYKFKKTAQVQDMQSRRNEYSYSTPTTRKPTLRHEVNQHKDVFEDMLMLKLVSYYENKYQVDGGHTQDEMSYASVLPTLPTHYEKPKPRKVQSLNLIGVQPEKRVIENHSKRKIDKHQVVDEVIVL